MAKLLRFVPVLGCFGITAIVALVFLRSVDLKPQVAVALAEVPGVTAVISINPRPKGYGPKDIDDALKSPLWTDILIGKHQRGTCELPAWLRSACLAWCYSFAFRSPWILLGAFVAWANSSTATFIINQRIHIPTANLSTMAFVMTLSPMVFRTYNWMRIRQSPKFSGDVRMSRRPTTRDLIAAAVHGPTRCSDLPCCFACGVMRLRANRRCSRH